MEWGIVAELMVPKLLLAYFHAVLCDGLSSTFIPVARSLGRGLEGKFCCSNMIKIVIFFLATGHFLKRLCKKKDFEMEAILMHGVCKQTRPGTDLMFQKGRLRAKRCQTRGFVHSLQERPSKPLSSRWGGFS